jgi:galactokinase
MGPLTMGLSMARRLEQTRGCGMGVDLQGLLAAFAEWVGGAPDGVWSAPGRVNLIGEHTDYNDGFVLPVAIDRHVAVAARRRADDRLVCWSLQQGSGSSSGWAAYVEGVAWALGQLGVAAGGADVVVDSDLPTGAGLSSSAALEGATALALADLAGAQLDRLQMALAAHRAESEFVGVPCGVMDQMAVMLGRAGHALFLDTRALAAELVPFPLETAGLRLVVVDTRVARRLTQAPYADRRRACHQVAATLGVAALRDVSLTDLEGAAGLLGEAGFRRARHVVTENARVLELVAALRDGHYEPAGHLMAASHASLRDDFEVSCPELDLAVAAAVESGAAGARMTGAGFGGSALALVPEDRVEVVAEAVRAAFADRGFRAPAVFEATTADGALRVA